MSDQFRRFRQHELVLTEDEYHIHRFRIPGQLRSELGQIAQFEIENNTPFLVGEVYHWLEIEHSNSSVSSGEAQIRCIIIPKAIVQSAVDSSNDKQLDRFSWIFLLNNEKNAFARLPVSKVEKRTLKQNLKPLILMAISIAALLLTVGSYLSDSKQLDDQISALSAQLNTTKNIYSNLAKELREVEAKQLVREEIFATVSQNKIHPIDALSTLMQARGSDVEIQNIRITPNEIIVALEALDIIAARENFAKQFQSEIISIQGAINRRSASREFATLSIKREQQ